MKELVKERKDALLQQQASLEAQIAEQQSRIDDAQAEQQRLYPVLYACQGGIQICNWLLVNDSTVAGIPEAEEADIIEVTV